jgi:hypothetical protein
MRQSGFDHSPGSSAARAVGQRSNVEDSAGRRQKTGGGKMRYRKIMSCAFSQRDRQNLKKLGGKIMRKSKGPDATKRFLRLGVRPQGALEDQG